MGFSYDCRIYWELAKQFDGGMHFSLLNFNEALRGYLFSLLLYPSFKCSELFHLREISFCRLYLLSIFSLFYSFGLCASFRLLFKSNLRPYFHAFFGFIFIVLWWEFFTIPLSDMAGFVFLLLSFSLLEKHKLLYYFLSGACLYAAFNIRLVYIVAIPFYLLLYFVSIKSQINKIRLVLVSLLGFLLLASPQIYINAHNFNTYSLLVPTHLSKVTGGKSLYLMQLNWGLSMQKYETNIGSEYPIPQIRYLDVKGQQLSIIHGNKDFVSYAEYFNFCISHPDVSLLYLKHVFNGFDITTPKAYLSNTIYHRSNVLKWFNYSLLFIGFLGLIFRFKESSFLLKIVTAMIFCVVVIIIPTATETRFYLPLHFVFYAFGIHFLQNISVLNWNVKSWILLFLCYFCFIGLCYFRSNATRGQIEFKSQHL